MQKNKLLLAAYAFFIVILSVSVSYTLFAAAVAVSFAILNSKRRAEICKRSFFAVIFFTGLTFAGSLVAAVLFGFVVDYEHFALLLCRAFSMTLMTLSVIDRIGVFNIFSKAGPFAVFIVLLFSKIESLKKQMQEFSEAARSRGFVNYTLKDSLSLLSVIVTALLIRSLDGFKTSAEAMKSRGYGA